LLAAFLQSDQTATTGKALDNATYKLPDLLKIIFDKTLYFNDSNTDKENFLERYSQARSRGAQSGDGHHLNWENYDRPIESGPLIFGFDVWRREA